jgi:hypothetical protein
MIEDDTKYHQTTINIIKKLQPTINRFKHVNKLLTIQKMKHLYYMHVYPHLIGAITIWGTHKHNKEYIQPLIRTQKKITRLTTNQPPRAHTQPLMEQLEILNITNLYTLRVTIELHQYIHPTEEDRNRPEHNHNYTLTTQVHDHQTRQAQENKYYIPNSNLLRQAKITQRTAEHTAEHFNTKYITIWNKLPKKLRDNTNPNNFKKEVKTHLLKKQNER